MRFSFPEHPIRRVDVAVGALLWAWNAREIAASPWLAAMQPRMLRSSLYREIAAILLLDALLWSAACLGIVGGRRWGFVSAAVLLLFSALGSILRLLVSPVGAMLGIGVPLGLLIAAFVYSLARFSALRPAPKYPRAFR